MMIDSRFEYFNSLLNLSRTISPHSKNSSPKKRFSKSLLLKKKKVVFRRKAEIMFPVQIEINVFE
ncbi:hypothetical protein GIB67_005800 [Kingdonia uniflora]|uniref:Uncharacterized protein n=1 Tax=Kingdonia uniflora TaxID=39325 RepID=A0A7J7MBJ0_9MAGN|nr:hypothetical protein GIB67_005800 [Kingdonia uniflora]